MSSQIHPRILPLFASPQPVYENFGLVISLSIAYAYSVKHRVEIYENPSSTTINGAEDEDQPLLGISQAASDPLAHQNSSSRYTVFTIYVTHLMICRIIPMVMFAALLITSSNFPVKFHCQWPNTESTSHANFNQSQMSNSSTVDCTCPMGNKNEKLTATVVTINFFYGVAALIELADLLWSAWQDRTLCTDMEFCCVYLLRKRKRIRKLMKKIRENISKDIFYLHDDFGDKRLSRRKLEKMYVNVIITDGRKNGKKFRSRHEIYEVHLTEPANATTLNRTEDIFKRKRAGNENPRTILVVGRPCRYRQNSPNRKAILSVAATNVQILA